MGLELGAARGIYWRSVPDALVAELVDAQHSGCCELTLVEVRFLSRAQTKPPHAVLAWRGFLFWALVPQPTVAGYADGMRPGTVPEVRRAT